MVLSSNDFEEKVENVSSSTSAFTLRVGTASSTFVLRINMVGVPGYLGPVFNADSEVLPLDLINLPQVILGGVNTNVGDGRLNRLMPLAHPQFPWCYASRIQNVRGIGAPIKFPSISPLEASPMPSFALYATYEITIEFTSVNYAVLTDDNIELNEFDSSWIDVDNEYAPDVDQTYATEWMRFTEYQVVPQTDWITATQGNGMFFQTVGGTGVKATDPGAAGGALFAAQPRILLPNEIIKFTWRMVPFRYYSSPYSYLRRFRGKVNYFDWCDWKAGELLYLTANPVRFTPPILQPENWLSGSTTVEKWCDMEILFLSTRRPGVNVPIPSSLPNGNFVPAGHNLLPWNGDNQFYYAALQSPPLGSGAPAFYSFPVELLFTDPDANNGVILDNAGGGPELEANSDINPFA